MSLEWICGMGTVREVEVSTRSKYQTDRSINQDSPEQETRCTSDSCLDPSQPFLGWLPGHLVECLVSVSSRLEPAV